MFLFEIQSQKGLSDKEGLAFQGVNLLHKLRKELAEATGLKVMVTHSLVEMAYHNTPPAAIVRITPALPEDAHREVLAILASSFGTGTFDILLL